MKEQIVRAGGSRHKLTISPSEDRITIKLVGSISESEKQSDLEFLQRATEYFLTKDLQISYRGHIKPNMREIWVRNDAENNSYKYKEM